MFIDYVVVPADGAFKWDPSFCSYTEIQTCQPFYFLNNSIKNDRFLKLTMITNSPIAPEKCDRTTWWNAELVHLIEVLSFPAKVDHGFENNRKLFWDSNLNFRQAISQEQLEVNNVRNFKLALPSALDRT